MNEDNGVQREYLHSDEVAEKFGVPEQTIRDWAEKGQLIASKIGSRWFFPKSQFTKLVKIICTYCGNVIKNYNSDLDLKEAKISGMCQDCISKTFKPK